MSSITEIAPGEMAELTKQFIEKKSVNDRVALRLRMKAVLDYLSTDTEFPPNPLLKKDPVPGAAREAAIAAVPNVAPGYVVAGMNQLGAVAPLDAPQRIDNTEILG